MSLPKAKDSLGSLRSQHKSIKNCFCKKLKGTSLHHLHLRHHHLSKQLVDADIREKKYSPISIPSAQLAVPSTSEENSPISKPTPNRKKNAILCCNSKHRRGKFTNTCTIGLCASWHASLATTNQKRWNSAYKSNRLFQFCS